MAYYVNRHDYFDGDLVLYQRDLAAANKGTKKHRPLNWHMKLRIGGKRYERSTKCTNHGDAYIFAKAELHRLQQAVQLGHPLDEYTFEQHWQDWYDRQVECGVWKAERKNWHQKYADRYFKAYFSDGSGKSLRLNEITRQHFHDYWKFRINFWKSIAGQKLKKYNAKRRGAKTTFTANAKKEPAKKTLQMEQSALNQIFADAHERGRLQRLTKMKIPARPDEDTRRPHFEDDEYKKLVRYLLSYRNSQGIFKKTKKNRVNKWHELQRKQLYHFVFFMLHSGLRVGEARDMRWRDVKLDQESESIPDKIAVVSVRKTTKTRRARDVQTQPTANSTLKKWKDESPYKGDDDFVWFGQTALDSGEQSPIKSLNKSFQNFLMRVPFSGRKYGLLFDKEGSKRSLYSLRHTYATRRIIQDGVSYDDLSVNMGCKVAQIEKHYYHADANRLRGAITRSKRWEKKQQQKQNAANRQLAEVLTQIAAALNAGNIDTNVALDLVKSASEGDEP